MMIYNFLYTGLSFHYLSAEDVSAWADREICKGSNDPDVHALSLHAGKEKEMWIQLSYLKDNMYQTVPYYLSLYRVLLEKGVSTEWDIGKELLKFNSSELMDFNYDIYSFISYVWECFDLKKYGIKDANFQLIHEVETFLADYGEDISIFKTLNFKVCGVAIASL